MPLEVRKWIDWDRTKKDYGPWPGEIMVSLWFTHETASILMIEILKMMREETAKTKYCVHGERVRTNLEMSPKKEITWDGLMRCSSKPPRMPKETSQR